MPARIHALIPAAGQSLRFGGTIIKQYANLLGKPVIAHSIDAVSRHTEVVSVSVAISADDGLYEELVRPDYPDVATVVGGDCRARTVLNGIRHIAHSIADEEEEHSQDWVLVHDAARPCLSTAALERLIQQALNTGQGAILAVPVSDTLKKADSSGQIMATVSRQDMWRAQTPQLFPLKDLLASLEGTLNFGVPPTDESEAMERSGHASWLVNGCADNIKITRPEDLAIAEAILRRHQGNQGS
jgi:2-C-methyl-D-erythritol 4-phosphate cytidylyltransferase